MRGTIAVCAGAVCICAGAAWIYLPLGLIVAGLFILGFAVMGASHAQPR